ncbi:MAG: hypothetical protein ACFFD9_11000 [Candidatus Thorarchaeota archaeon]
MNEDPNDITEQKSAGEFAFDAGSIMMNYAKGVAQHGKMNLDDAIRFLEKSLKLAVNSHHTEYIMKSQIQLAAVHLKRYRVLGNEKDYRSAFDYSDRLAEIAEEQNLVPGLVEALLLRALLKRTARDLGGAREDLLRARNLAIEKNLKSVHSIISRELDEFHALQEEPDFDIGKVEDIDRYLDDVPGVFSRLMNQEMSRKPILSPVKLYQLVVMNPDIGLPIYTYDFAEVKETGIHVYGLLSAVSTVGTEMMPDAGLIRTLTHEGKTIMMEHDGDLMGALIADRESFRARMSLRSFISGFRETYPTEDWRGQILSESVKEEVDFLLARCFQELVREDAEKE